MARLTGEIKKFKNEEGRLIDLYKEGLFDLEVLKGKVAEARLLRAEHERDLLLLEKQQAFIEDPAEKQRGLEEHARRDSPGRWPPWILTPRGRHSSRSASKSWLGKARYPSNSSSIPPETITDPR